ncbi:MAG: minor capsid protein [Treponema sp.]|nr:minor capsid protein [Treponema sp.]
MAKDVLKVEFPQGKIYVTNGGNGKAYIEYNKSYVNKFNNDLNKTQVFLDNKVIMHLQEYVSYKHGVQAKSIRLTSDAGSGLVHINVPYAEYQAYSKRIKKRVGKRGTYPFERMKADKKDTILKQVEAYSRRLNG